MNHPAIAHIDLDALHYNLHKIKADVPNSNILAMVKRNAYGHGAVEVAEKIDQDVSAFGVVFLKEAIQLNKSRIKKPIVVLTGFYNSEELNQIDKFGFECGVHNFVQLEILEKEKDKLSRQLNVWLKIDSGMHRLGFQPHQIQDVYQRLMKNKMVKKPLRLMTHFSDADNAKSNKTAEQISCFKQVVSGLDGELCMANSSAILNWPKASALWVRPGITLYGASPFSDKNGLELGLKPVMTLSSRVIAIHELEQNESVGYGSTFRCPEKMLVGTVSIGYGDGYPRNTKGGAPVLIDGIRTQLLGRVAMDMIGVDLRPVPNAKIGSLAVLWGNGLPIEEISIYTGESQYEMLVGLTSRMQYQFH